MALIGYARVSSTGQSLEVQRDLLKEAGCTRVFEEKRSGTTTDGREQLALALDYVRDTDTFVVTRLDRLARSVVDLRQIVDRLTDKGVGFQCLQQPIETASSTGRLALTILAAFAEFETDLRRERQADGIAKAKAAGVYKGRPVSVPEGEIHRLSAEGIGPSEIARRLKVGRASVYRALSRSAP